MMEKQKEPNWQVLIVDDIHQICIDKLESFGLRVDYRPDINLDETLTILPFYDVLIIRSKFRVESEVLSAGKKLKCIGRAGAGMDNINEQLAAEAGVKLLNAPEGNRDAVGEHLIGMLLALMNNLVRANEEVRAGAWHREENRGLELGGKTVALIGYGNNGQAMARKLSGFDVRVIAYDKYKTGFSDKYAQEVSMEQVVKEADVLSLHIPLTRETRNLVNGEYLHHFRKPFFFLNAARGEIVDVDAVLKGIKEKSILGAAFDVLPVEKFPNMMQTSWYEELRTNERVLLSPHVAGWSVESYYKLADVLSDKIIEFLRSSID